ncbi:hypothetical protein MTO96_036246 [Rhipicephalus appendiculatus]
MGCSRSFLRLAGWNRFFSDVRCVAPILAWTNFATTLMSTAMIFLLLFLVSERTDTELDAYFEPKEAPFVSVVQALLFLEPERSFSVLYFSLMFLTGICDLVIMQEVVMEVFVFDFPAFAERTVLAKAALCLFVYALSLPFCSGVGPYLVDLLDVNFKGTLYLLVNLAEVLVVTRVYGLRRLIIDAQTLTNATPNIALRAVWSTVLPISLTVLVLSCLLYDPGPSNEGHVYPAWAKDLMLGLALAGFGFVPAYAIAAFVSNRWTKAGHKATEAKTAGPDHSEPHSDGGTAPRKAKAKGNKGSEGKRRIESEAAVTGATETPSGVARAGEHVRGRELSELAHLASESGISARVPEKELSKGRRKARSEHAAPEVLDAAVAHTPTGHTLRASVCVDGKATPGPPDPIVMPSAVVCGPSGGDSDGAIWRGTGARPKDRRTIPPDQSGSKAASGEYCSSQWHCVTSPIGGKAPCFSPPGQYSPPPTLQYLLCGLRRLCAGLPTATAKGQSGRVRGVRRRGRILPSDLFDSSDSEEDPAFCGGSSFSPPNDDAVSRREVTTAAAPVPAPGGHDSEDDSEHKCPECGRTFASKSGLSQRRRHAHIDAYNADIDIERSKPRWTKEEEYLMAIYEVQLRKDKVRNINQMMAKKFSSRTFDGIKSHRRQERYQVLVEEMLARSDGPVQRNLDQDGVEPLPDDRPALMGDESAQPEPIDARRAISEELLMLVNKPPPRAFQGYRLWEITKRFLNGEHVGSSLDS